MAAGSTYTPIATTTLGSSTATVTFSSIPSTYTDLVLVATMLQNGTATNTNGFVQLNSSTSGYSKTAMYGNGTIAGSFRDSNSDRMYFFNDATATERVTQKYEFMNYANTNVYKTVLSRAGSSTVTGVICHLWQNTAAINTISLTASDNTGGGGNDQFVAGSTFTLYGITAA
jgi:hypothetical protein